MTPAGKVIGEDDRDPVSVSKNLSHAVECRISAHNQQRALVRLHELLVTEESTDDAQSH
jgi:hypothetical protein